MLEICVVASNVQSGKVGPAPGSFELSKNALAPGKAATLGFEPIPSKSCASNLMSTDRASGFRDSSASSASSAPSSTAAHASGSTWVGSPLPRMM